MLQNAAPLIKLDSDTPRLAPEDRRRAPAAGDDGSSRDESVAQKAGNPFASPAEPGAHRREGNPFSETPPAQRAGDDDFMQHVLEL